MTSQPASTIAFIASIDAVDVGEAGRQVADQRAAALGAGLREGRRATVLGDRLARVVVGLGLAEPEPLDRGAHVLVAAAGEVDQDRRARAAPSRARSAPATACADSIAGMMPSVRASSANASIASASVTGRYVARPVSAR